MKKIIVLCTVILLMLVMVAGCSDNNNQDKPDFVQYLHSITPDNTEAYFYNQEEIRSGRKLLSDDDVRALADILAGIESGQITEYYEDGTESPPKYSLHLIVDGADWGIFLSDSVHEQPRTMFQGKFWWIESDALANFMRSF